jgi:hypothetical protein
MSRKLFSLIALFAVLFSVAYAKDFSENIKLKLFEDSSKHWLAVDPLGDDDATVKIEMLEATSNDWVEMKLNADFGYWQVWASSPSGFALPVSFRLTSEDGEQVILDNVVSDTSAAGKELETAVQFQKAVRSSRGGNDDDDDDSRGGGRPSWCPTERPTRPTNAPSTPTNAPSTPTNAPATQAPATQAPTQRPSQPDSQTPTQRPTQRPTQAPATQAPTQRPTQRPTSAPTQRPTSAPTQRPSTPTSAPTQRPTTPTSAPTQRPSTGSSGSTDLCAITPTSQEPVKILVPLYMEPGKGWDDLIASANAGTSIVAIINPNSGPVTSGPPSNWVTYINKMKAANIDMVGYVHTSYGARSISEVKAEIDVYASKYAGLKGIFLDEVSAQKGDIPYYKQAYDHIMSKSGYIHDILNPGASTDQGYLDVSSNIVVYESSASSYKSPTSSWIKCAPSSAQKAGWKYKFSGIVYGASQSQMSSIASQMASAGIGMVFITDRTLPNPYNPLPSYWSAEATAVKGL